MRVFLSNLGCKLNQAELEQLARELAAAGHRVVPGLGDADVHLVNTCTVTHAAARDSRKLARRARRRAPGVRTVLTGCHVSGPEAEEARRLPGVDLVVPNAEKERLVERLHRAFPELRPGGGGSPEEAPASEVPASEVPVPYVPLAFGNARAAVKVEDGCNMRCAFCIIPTTRGRQRSRPVRDVVADVGGLAAAGFPEVVITGVQISAYRHGGSRLADLVAALLDETPVGRLRLTSIAPWGFDPRLLDLVGGGRVCRHFHFSLQSGAGATLARMRRPYDAADFRRLVEEVRAAVPGVAITTDVIVGFPGESDAEFEESLDFVADTGFARVHAFPYSARPGTEAAGLPGRVAPERMAERMERMLAVAREAAERFRRERVGERAEVLWERRRGGWWSGTTDHYVKVGRPHAGEDLARRRQRVVLAPPASGRDGELGVAPAEVAV